MRTKEELLAAQNEAVTHYRSIPWRVGPDRSADEVDALMARVAPGCRRWGCRYVPGMAEDQVRSMALFGCACPGCLWGQIEWPSGISYSEYLAWEERESKREPTPWAFDHQLQPPIPTLAERLAAHKARKLSS